MVFRAPENNEQQKGEEKGEAGDEQHFGEKDGGGKFVEPASGPVIRRKPENGELEPQGRDHGQLGVEEKARTYLP